MTSQGWKRRAATAALLACLAAGGVLTPACGSATDPSPTLGVTCPLPITAESLTGAPITVTYETPTAVGGTSPVNVSCVPPSGTAFSLGTTNVTCTARDAKQKTAACSFGVSVVRVPPLNVTRFMAFGDSITFGTPSTPCAGTTAASVRAARENDLRLLFELTTKETPPSTSYPSVLLGLLRARYVSQTFVMANEGVGGERITGEFYPATIARMRQTVRTNAPQVVLLLEGINDINEMFFHDASRIPQLTEALRDLAKEARLNGAQQVLLGTLLPEDPNGCRGNRGYDLVAPANTQIKTMAAAEGLTVVDIYQAFGGVPGPYIGPQDGLHPTNLGYEKMAQTFLDSIKKAFETH